MSLTRRSFLKGSAATAALSVVGGSAVNVLSAEAATLANGPGNKWPGRVVVNFNKAAVTGSITVNEAVVKQMVDDAIKLLTDQTTIGAAWKVVFPSSLTATSKIAIKINILNDGNAAPHAFSVMAITEGLQQMDIGGKSIPPENITIYDMNNSSSMDSAGYTAARFPNIKRVKDTAQVHGDGALNNRSYAKTLKECNFLINVFSPRGHSLPTTGNKFTLGFKSHYGTYSNPSGMHSTMGAYQRDINCNGPVLEKTVLSVCSGIFGMNEGNGPTGGIDNYSTYSKKVDATSTNVNPTTIIMSTDPVSCEMQAIKMMRINKGKSYATADLPDYLKAAGGVTGTLTPVYNIGIIEESAMDVRKIINGLGTTSNKSTAPKLIGSTAGITATQLRGQNTTFIEFAVPKSYVNQNASIEIVNLNGVTIRELKCGIQGVANQISWDETDLNGRPVSSGTYIVRLRSESLGISTRLTLAR